jgi:hypothetical protein
MIAIPIIYAIIAVLVFIVLQEIVGIPAALFTSLLWLPALIIGIITRIIRKDEWKQLWLGEWNYYPEDFSDDQMEAYAQSYSSTKMAEKGKFWLIWLAIGIVYELYAIITDKVDTLSERVWYWLGKHWIFRVAFIGFWVWAFIHIVFGPCAFGVC